MQRCKAMIATLVLTSSLLTSCHQVTTTTGTLHPLNPKAAEINRQLTVEYLQRGEVATAREKLNLALQQNPQSPMVLDTAAYFYHKTGNDAAAQEYFQRAIQQAPSTARYHNNYGVYLCQKKQYHAAIDQFLMAATDIEYLHPDKAYENAGMCAQQMNRLDLAASYYQQALKINPKRANALLQLAQISYDSGQFGLAAAYLKHYQAIARATTQSQQLAILLKKQPVPKAVVAKPSKTITHQQKVSS